MVDVLDTATGGEVFRAEGSAASARITPLAWSPDSRWLLFIADGELQAWPVGGEAAARHVAPPWARLLRRGRRGLRPAL